MNMNTNINRVYNRSNCAVFCKTHEEFGELSNMAAGFPITVNGIEIRTTEALYQACRYPHLPDVQKKIINQKSPMTAKMVGKPYRSNTRSDWDAIRINTMRWCLRVKLLKNWERFGKILLYTKDLSIVEESKKDTFWGAKAINEDTLEGVNALGRLLMELREEYRQYIGRSTYSLVPPKINNFLLMGEPVKVITINLETSESVQSIPDTYSQPNQLSFFD